MRASASPRCVMVFCLVWMAVAWHCSGGTVIEFEHDYSKYGKVSNTADGICAAVATINPFVYLRNQYPSIYGGTNIIPDWNQDNVIDEKDYVTSRDKLAYGWDSQPGIYGGGNNGLPDQWWNAKNAWLDQFAPGTTVFRGQSPWVDGSWTRASQVQDKVPDWKFLMEQLRHCEDVEIGFYPWGGQQWKTGHAVILTGFRLVDCNDNGEWDRNEEFSLFYCDPNDPENKKTAQVSLDSVGGWENIMKITWWQDGGEYFILNAFSESPVPDAATGFLFSSGLVVVLPLLRRRR